MIIPRLVWSRNVHLKVILIVLVVAIRSVFSENHENNPKNFGAIFGYFKMDLGVKIMTT